jgi:hypothetical protein
LVTDQATGKALLAQSAGGERGEEAPSG